MKREARLIILIIIMVLLLITLIVIENNMVELNSYSISSNKLPQGAQLKIAQISDFHNCKLGDETVKRLEESSPDIIVITGDLIDSRKTNLEPSLSLVDRAVKIAPCYYVTGNHEARTTSEYAVLKSKMLEMGVRVLENESELISINGLEINLIGLTDPRFSYDNDSAKKAKNEINQGLEPLISTEHYNLVLCHRPEAFYEYASLNVDLALTGHAHGGQIIIFGVGAVAPNQGIFPKYIKGIYEKDETKMIVSRGIGNSLFPFRLNNRPEVVQIIITGDN